ncbi:MAG: hypothetical protein JJU34_13110 [Lunatimonas sp.]|uniref:glycoside hydrolase family 2 TIM barrel-domain containing protein n=1 Tax=Lunatimonas sp. TaxID=2060141 RepID=UPI002A3E7ACD|nr:hypothetical protein [Lunatimonas sp.]
MEIKYLEGRAVLYREGVPFRIKGAAGTEHLDKLAAYGGNSIRTWSLHNAEEILDEAHKNGLTVTLGLEVGIPYWGEDFNYWNLWAVDRKIDELRPSIEKYKDHPALLMWGVGNEVSLKGGPRYLVYYILNRIAKMVKEVDPDHPTMTAINMQTFGRTRYLMPHIDVLGYNGFSEIVPFYASNKNYGNKGWGKAYILSEWGPPGHWEVQDTEWGAPLEMSNSLKTAYQNQYWELISQDSLALIGTYAFYWGNKFEITPTWFSLFSEEGYESESVQFLRWTWTGQEPGNFAPRIEQLLLDGQVPSLNTYLTADSSYSAEAIVEDRENDPITFRWEIREEESKFYEVNPYQYNMIQLLPEDFEAEIEFKTPKNEGAYRLYVYAFDGNGNFASSNLPFYVINR